MTFARLSLAIAAAGLVAGAGYGLLQLSAGRTLQQASVSGTVAGASSIAGTWTSVDDASYQVSFAEDGSLTERYAGETISTGTYRLASDPAGYVAVDVGLDGDGRYLLEDLDGEKYAYQVLSLTARSLELRYLERGNTLTFTR